MAEPPLSTFFEDSKSIGQEDLQQALFQKSNSDECKQFFRNRKLLLTIKGVLDAAAFYNTANFAAENTKETFHFAEVCKAVDKTLAAATVLVHSMSVVQSLLRQLKPGETTASIAGRLSVTIGSALSTIPTELKDFLLAKAGDAAEPKTTQAETTPATSDSPAKKGKGKGGKRAEPAEEENLENDVEGSPPAAKVAKKKGGAKGKGNSGKGRGKAFEGP